MDIKKGRDMMNVIGRLKGGYVIVLVKNGKKSIIFDYSGQKLVSDMEF